MESTGKRFTGSCRILLLVCLVNLTSGCFVAHPVEEVPAPSTEIQVALTDEAAARISLQAGRALQGVTGRVLTADADSLILSVRWTEIAGGSSGRPGPDVVRLAQADIEQINRPRFSLARSLVLAGGIALVAVGIVAGILNAGGGDSEDEPGPDPPQPR